MRHASPHRSLPKSALRISPWNRTGERRPDLFRFSFLQRGAGRSLCRPGDRHRLPRSARARFRVLRAPRVDQAIPRCLQVQAAHGDPLRDLWSDARSRGALRCPLRGVPSNQPLLLHPPAGGTRLRACSVGPVAGEAFAWVSACFRALASGFPPGTRAGSSLSRWWCSSSRTGPT